MKKLFLGLFVALSSFTAFAVPVQVDLSTGASGGLLAVGSNDDTWTTVQLPNLTWANAIVSNGTLWDGVSSYPNTWAESTCGRWISPTTITAAGATFGMIPDNSPAGDYRYRITFNIPCLTPGGAFIQLNFAGADNSLTQIIVNGNTHNMAGISFNPLSTGLNVTLGVAELTTGTNTIDVIVHNNSHFTGLYLCGYLQYEAPGAPKVKLLADDKLCTGDQVIATATTTSGTVVSHQWNLYESTSGGSYIPGGYNWWSSTIAGAPNYSYIFPNSTTLPCNKYYTIRIITNNGCQSFVNSIVIFISCNNPAFSLSNNTSNPNYYTMTATPNDLFPYGPVGGFGYAWFVEELNSLGNPIFTISNPSIWWTFTANNTGYQNNFQGFDCSIAYSGTVTSLPGSPAVGHFCYNRTYRITRGTWVTDYCDWRQFSQTITITPKPASDGSLNEYDMMVAEDLDAPDMREAARLTRINEVVADNGGDLKLYPNPAGNEVNIEFRSSRTYQADYAIQDVSGRIVLKGSFKVNEGKNHQQIAVDHLNEGMYLLRMSGTTEIKKLMIQR